MDINGYMAYPYDQCDELSRQQFAQQRFSNSLLCQRSYPEAHAMPLPSGAPWNVQGVSWGSMAPPQLVQFTGQPSTSGLHLPPVIHSKRKSLDVEPVIPAKQLITEEKMAAHFNSLHISGNNTDHSPAFDEMMEETLAPAPVILNDKIKVNKVVLADEIKKLHAEPLLPPSILERLEKPCMSLIVWQPKEQLLDIASNTDQENNNTENPKKRNGLLVAESANIMDVEM